MRFGSPAAPQVSFYRYCTAACKRELASCAIMRIMRTGIVYDSMNVADLKQLAERRGIKEQGVGWPVCCPQDGIKDDIIRALERHDRYRNDIEMTTVVRTPSSVVNYLLGSLSRSKNSGYAWLSLPVESTKMLGVCNESTMLS